MHSLRGIGWDLYSYEAPFGLTLRNLRLIMSLSIQFYSNLGIPKALWTAQVGLDTQSASTCWSQQMGCLGPTKCVFCLLAKCLSATSQDSLFLLELYSEAFLKENRWGKSREPHHSLQVVLWAFFNPFFPCSLKEECFVLSDTNGLWNQWGSQWNEGINLQLKNPTRPKQQASSLWASDVRKAKINLSWPTDLNSMTSGVETR